MGARAQESLGNSIEVAETNGEKSDLRLAYFPSFAGKPLPIAAGYPERVLIPLALRLWERAHPDYAPEFYEAPRVIEMDRTRTPGGWADPPDLTREEFHLMKKAGALRSYEGEVRLDAESGRPLNPAGRTGIAGRGLLGKWGANQAADALLTRINAETGELEALLIQRDDGAWAIPGGMIDDGEDALTAAKRELREEAGVEILQSSGKLVYQGMGDGPRATDNAWIETTLYHFHFEVQDPRAEMIPTAGPEALDAKWQPVDQALLATLYSNHGELLAMALSQWRLGNQPQPEKVIEQLDQIPHAATLTSFSDLHGRIGILGGTFDPTQVAHVYAARIAIEARALDAVVFVPAAQNPIKEHAPGAFSRERLDMVCRAVQDDRRMFVAPLEMRKGGVSYTIDTVRAIRQQLPDESAIFLILGSDCLPDLPRWREFDQLRKLVTFVPIERKQSEEISPVQLERILGRDFAFQLRGQTVQGMGIEVSSTAIRRAIAERRETFDLISPAVADYIHARGLYRNPAAKPLKVVDNRD